MNKEEAKQKLHNLAFAKLNTKPDDLKLADVMQIVNQIDEPQKPVVKQFVAEWYEENKDCLNYSIWQYVYNWHDQEETEFKRWFAYSKNSFETLIGMSHYGYEIEKEAKYTVKVKATKQYLCNDELGPHFSPSFRSNFTKTNLEELGFGWVFDCQGVEVEEV